MEMLDVVDEKGEPTGEVVSRRDAHARGIRHRTSHVWIYRIQDGKPQLLVQKRCADKDAFPGCYDTSSAGHIPAGDGFVISALRELQEELGVDVSAEQLIECGFRKIAFDQVFHGIPFHDRQISKVFLLELPDMEEQDFAVQESEIERVCWMDLNDVVKMVKEHTPSNCIALEELALLKNGDVRLAF